VSEGKFQARLATPFGGFELSVKRWLLHHEGVRVG